MLLKFILEYQLLNKYLPLDFYRWRTDFDGRNIFPAERVAWAQLT
jgi:hypothetical protein